MSQLVVEETKESVPIFVYWKINSRAQTSMLLLHAGNKKYTWDYATANTWPSPKEKMPFGQLPVLYHNGITIPQSGTMARYCSSLAGLVPGSDKDSVMSDMLMEHSNDIFNLFSKAKYSGDEEKQRESWIAIRDKKLPKMLRYLAKLLGDKQYFTGSRLCAGDVAVFSVLNLALRAGLKGCLNNYPTLRDHYKKVTNVGTVRNFLEANYPTYYTAVLESSNEQTEVFDAV